MGVLFWALVVLFWALVVLFWALVVTFTGTFRPGGAERPVGEVIRGLGAPHAVLGFAVAAGAVVVLVGAGDEAPMFGKDGLPFPHAPTEVI